MTRVHQSTICLLPGETVLKEGTVCGGKILLTNYRFISVTTNPDNIWSIPLTVIYKLEVVDLLYLRITTKLGLSLSCEFDDDTTCELWLGSITRAADRTGIVEDSFCFRFRTSLQSSIPEHPFLFGTNKLFWGATEACGRPGPNLVCRERTRMGFSEAWKVTEANKSFKICPSYPEYHIVPRDVEDSVIAKIADFRTNRRFPSVVWRSQTTGAVLLRCSQPCVGLMGYRNEFDEKFMCNVSRSCQKNPGSRPINGPKRLLIVDARTYRVAQFRRLLGGGYEHTAYYDDAEICFMDLPNLHKVRLSFESLIQLYAMDSDASWFSLLDKTYWLTYISQLLKCSVDIATELESVGRLVMIHCTDGWDRTAQLSSLAQLLADPYYRTIEGFSVLVEREWLQFGHKFADRCGQDGLTRSKPDEQSPIFLEWLDCVHQIRLQFPHEFQFNELFLVKLAIHVYSGLFGTFLCNSEQERQEDQITSKTCSVWGLLSPRYNWTIVNPSYQPGGQNLLKPDWRLSCLRLWNCLYRNALLPSAQTSIGIVSLNNITNNVDSELVDNAAEHITLAEHAIEKEPEASTGTPFFSAEATILPEDCRTDNIGTDLRDYLDAPLKQSDDLEVSVQTTCLQGSHRNFLSDLTNTSDAINSLPPVLDLNTPEEKFQPLSKAAHPYADSHVATLPISATNDDNPLSSNPILTSATDQINCQLDPLDLGFQSTRRPRLASNSSRDDIFLSYRRNCVSPRPRSSFSTDTGPGVFVPDDDLEASFSAQFTTPSHRTSLILGQACNSDDECFTRWDTYSSRSNNPTTDSVNIQTQRDFTGLPNNDPRTPRQIDPVSNRISLCDRPEGDAFNGPVCEGSISSWSYSAAKCSTPSLEMTVPGNCMDILGATQPLDHSNYTIQSIPDSGEVLVGLLSTDLEISSSDFPTETNCSPMQFGSRCYTENELPSTRETMSDSMLRWRDMYFVPCVLGTPSTVSKTGSQEHTSRCVPFTQRTISVNAASLEPHSSSYATGRPLSAPSSPTLPESRTAVFCSQPATAPSNPILDTQHNSDANVLSSAASCCAYQFSNSILMDNLSIDWDGLPSLVDERAKAKHAHDHQEQCHLKMQLAKLSAELTELRAKLSKISFESDQDQRPTRPSPSPQSSNVTTARCSDQSAHCSQRSSVDSTPSILRPYLNTDGVSRTVVPPLDLVGQRRASSHSEINSYEVVDPVQRYVPVSSEVEPSQPNFFPRTCVSPNATVRLDELTSTTLVGGTNASELHRLTSQLNLSNGSLNKDGIHPDLNPFLPKPDSIGSPKYPLDVVQPLSELKSSSSSRFGSLQFCAPANLLPAASVGHLSSAGSSRSPSARCRSVASGTESTASPATSDGIAQA